VRKPYGICAIHHRGGPGADPEHKPSSSDVGRGDPDAPASVPSKIEAGEPDDNFGWNGEWSPKGDASDRLWGGLVPFAHLVGAECTTLDASVVRLEPLDASRVQHGISPRVDFDFGVVA